MKPTRARLVGLPPLLLAASLSALAAAPTPEILVSRQVLEKLDLEVGDVVDLATDPAGREARAYRIGGSYEPVPDPMRINRDRHEARMHLPDLLRLVTDPADPRDAEAVSAMNIRLSDPDDAADFARDLVGKMPGVMAIPTTDDSASNPFVALERFHLAIALITVVASTAFLLALMVMRAEERRETVGILRLLGFSKGRVLLEVFFEGLLVAVVGAAFGVALAVAGQDLFNRFFQWRYDTALVFMRVTAPIALRSVALAVPLGVLAGIVASWTLLRREVLALIRR